MTHNADCASKWYETLINAGENQKEVPVLWVRFEDLVTNPKQCLSQVMRFLLNMDDISGTNAERRIDEVCAKSKSSLISYKLKESTLRFNANRKRYNPAQK